MNRALVREFVLRAVHCLIPARCRAIFCSNPNMTSETHSITGVGQIAVVVSDVAQAKQFYSEILGLKLLFDSGPNLSFLGAGSIRIMLTTPQGAGETGKNSILYFRTNGIEQTYAIGSKIEN